MLYNPELECFIIQNWSDTSLASLVAWLETQPPDEVYCYTSNGSCLIAQYLTAKGYPDVSVGGSDCHYNWKSNIPVELSLPLEFYDISFCEPRTFGAALQRAKAAM